MPGVTYFKPAGIPLRSLEEIHLSVEEAEAIHLKDLEGLEQEEAAEIMNISRSTFQRVLSSARKKIADALLNGKALRIAGGNYELATISKNISTTVPMEQDESPALRKNMAEGSKLKIAVITEDGKTISKHFGRAPYYMIVTIENGNNRK